MDLVIKLRTIVGWVTLVIGILVYAVYISVALPAFVPGLDLLLDLYYLVSFAWVFSCLATSYGMARGQTWKNLGLTSGVIFILMLGTALLVPQSVMAVLPGSPALATVLQKFLTQFWLAITIIDAVAFYGVRHYRSKAELI